VKETSKYAPTAREKKDPGIVNGVNFNFKLPRDLRDAFLEEVDRRYGTQRNKSAVLRGLMINFCSMQNRDPLEVDAEDQQAWKAREEK